MYPRFVFDALPIRHKPQSQETLTSLLMRNAAANRLTSLMGLYATLTLSPQYRNPRSKTYLIDHPPSSWGDLATVLVRSREDLLATTFHHLVVRFGREPTWQPMGIFLSGSVAGALRFCPQCLAEQQEPYYRLSWRFSFLLGCAIHGCRLWDVCPQCGKAMPLFSAPFTVGRCALCQADLGLAKTVLLSPAEQVRVQTLTEDLIYLLSAPSDPLPLSLRRVLVRQQLTLMQHAAGKSRGQTHYDGSLLGCLHRLESIGASFRMLFDEGIWRENARLQDPAHRETPEAHQMGAALAERIATMQQEMMETGIPVTRQAIEDRLRIPLKQVSPYPEIQRALAHIPNELLLQHEERRLRRQAELLPRTPQALDQLEQEGKSLNASELGRLLQVDGGILRKFPGVMTALAERRAQRNRQHRANKQADRERKLVTFVAVTMAHMRGSGEQATVEGICKEAGITYATACRYPQVKALLSPLRRDQAKRTHEARWQAYRQTRDAELVEQITTAVHLLVTEGKPVTPYTVCRTMQVTSHSVKPYPRAWTLLEQYRLKQEPTECAMPQEEQCFITQLEAAIGHFDALGVRITHTLLCHHLHIPMADLAGRYPHARALMLEAKERTRHRPCLQVENLYEQVVGAIQTLETGHEPVTRNAICIRLHVSVHQINRDQKVKALIAEVMARRPDAEAVRHAKREDELIERLRKAYAFLAAEQESLSCTRLYVEAGKDERTFRGYPQACAAAEQLVAAHEQDVRRARSALVAMLLARTTEMTTQEARAMSDLPMQGLDNAPQLLHVHVDQAQRRRDRDAVLAAEVTQAIRELEESGQEVTCQRCMCVDRMELPDALYRQASANPRTDA
jgi:TniQ